MQILWPQSSAPESGSLEVGCNHLSFSRSSHPEGEDGIEILPVGEECFITRSLQNCQHRVIKAADF